MMNDERMAAVIQYVHNELKSFMYEVLWLMLLSYIKLINNTLKS